jgi:TolB-like protein
MSREKIIFLSIFIFVFTLVLTVAPVMPEQIITQETRSWAQEALAKEKAGSHQISKNTLGILYFHNKTGNQEYDRLQKGLAVMLIHDLSQIKGVQVVERIKMQALFEELNLGKSGLVSSETAPRVGRVMGAEYLLGGEMLTDQLMELQIDPGILDIPQEKRHDQSPVKGKLDEIIRIEKDILFGAVAKLEHIKLTKKEEEKLRQPLSTKIKALFHLFDAVDLSDNEKYEEATNSYLSAYQEDPKLSLARDAILEIIKKGLITAAVIVMIKQAMDRIEKEERGEKKPSFKFGIEIFKKRR